MNNFLYDAEKQMNAHSKQAIAKKEEFDIPPAPAVSRNLRNEPDPFEVQAERDAAKEMPSVPVETVENKVFVFKNNQPQVVKETPEEKAARFAKAKNDAIEKQHKNSSIYSRNPSYGMNPIKKRR
jgi:DNA polymerase sigma